MDTQKEIVQWGTSNKIEIGPDVIQLWNNAMQRGDEDSYNQFMKVWSQIKSNPDQYRNSTATPEAWRVAIVNQIEAQAVLSSMMGININSELYALRDKAIKDNGSGVDNILQSVVEMWKRLNDEISKRTKTEKKATNS